MAKWQYTKGLHDIGNGLLRLSRPGRQLGLVERRAWWRTAGETLLVDTLFDLPLTSEMLATMRSRCRRRATSARS